MATRVTLEEGVISQAKHQVNAQREYGTSECRVEIAKASYEKMEHAGKRGSSNDVWS